ncbi:hypothetical protein M6B38_268305 [Iris pallida]|uniref:Uncharacterized protein n=1 Tax=Iris pallida TaxID=29817 RepID=A0AAX6I9L8_IRIPA|nr:hypothetical protein M6B38_347130 [Iris pallida]KAJ6849701.1 hypothetical protein M6B38_268305 [Iris pallida]
MVFMVITIGFGRTLDRRGGKIGSSKRTVATTRNTKIVPEIAW